MPAALVALAATDVPVIKVVPAVAFEQPPTGVVAAAEVLWQTAVGIAATMALPLAADLRVAIKPTAVMAAADEPAAVEAGVCSESSLPGARMGGVRGCGLGEL